MLSGSRLGLIPPRGSFCEGTSMACVCAWGIGGWSGSPPLPVCFSSVRFKRGFESEPTLHSGINYAVLLLAAGHQFDSSFELRKVGEEPWGKRVTSAKVRGRLGVGDVGVGGADDVVVINVSSSSPSGVCFF